MTTPSRHFGDHRRRAPRLAALAFACSFGLTALSAGQSPAASDAPPAPTPTPTGERAAIVLILPLGSPAFGRVAEAVQAGFLAAAQAAKAKPRVIGHGDDNLLVAFAEAKSAGARVIVGPLLRDDMKTVAEAGLDLPPTIALNQLDEGAPLPPNMYTLSLTIDNEARQLARQARDGGALTVAVIASETPRQQRFASAFNAEWILAGGAAPVLYRFDPSAEGLRLLRRELARTPFAAVLLALDAPDAALAKPYVGKIPSYTSSQVNERRPAASLRDLDDVRFIDMPWLVDADAAAFADLKRPDYPNATLDRLYALGIDAFRVAQTFAEGTPEKFEFDGATGHIALDATRQFVREGRLMYFQAGRIVPVMPR